MKYCRKCGAQLRDDSEFCDKCGEKVIGTENNQPKKEKKSSTVIIIIAAIVIIAVVLIIVLGKSGSKDSAEKAEEIATEEETELLTTAEEAAAVEIQEEDVAIQAEESETEIAEIHEEEITETSESSTDNGFIGEWTMQDGRGLFIEPEEDHYRVTYEEYGEERPLHFAITCFKDGDRLVYDNEMNPKYEIDENGVNIPSTMYDRGNGFFEIVDVCPDPLHDPYGGEYTMTIAARDYPISENTSPCLLWFEADDSAAYNPFYGIWVGASKKEAEAQSIADTVSSYGFDGRVYVSSQWSNLNPETWYVVTAGAYQDEEGANNALHEVKTVYPDAYVKYSGMCIATPW